MCIYILLPVKQVRAISVSSAHSSPLKYIHPLEQAGGKGSANNSGHLGLYMDIDSSLPDSNPT